MMEEQPSTRDRIVDAAAELFHRQGFRGTSLLEVQRQADVRGGSLYYFFKTKEDLLEAALERYSTLLDPTIIDPAFARSDDPIERVFLVLGQYRRLLLDTDFAVGCPIGNLAIEMADATEEVRTGLASDFRLWARRIEGCLDRAAERLPPDVDRSRLATFVLTTMEGAVLLARGHRAIDPFDDAVHQLRDYFDRLLAAAGTVTAADEAPLSKENAR